MSGEFSIDQARERNRRAQPAPPSAFDDDPSVGLAVGPKAKLVRRGAVSRIARSAPADAATETRTPERPGGVRKGSVSDPQTAAAEQPHEPPAVGSDPIHWREVESLLRLIAQIHRNLAASRIDTSEVPLERAVGATALSKNEKSPEE